MDKMIKVINDNLRNVVSGIREHRVDLEAALDAIKSDMSLKVKEANAYKSDVETARTIVSALEDEIADLEHDLEELNNKFGTKNFKEILAAGNREINAKIIEKRTAINEQGQIILGLTEKAKALKDSLIELREKKTVTETNLHKTKTLESYYDTRITDIVKFSEENPEELATYKEEIPQEELNIQEDIDISSVIDGSIFEEIDGITSSEPDEDILKSVLANPDEIPVYEPEEEETAQPVEIEVSTANQLENMISEAKQFVEKKKNEKIEDETEKETETEDDDSDDTTVVQLEIEESIPEDNTEEDAEESEEVEEDSANETINDDSVADGELEEDVDPFLDIRGLQEELGLEEEEESVIDLKIEEPEVVEKSQIKEEKNIDKTLIADEKDFISNDSVDVEKEFDSVGLDLNMFSVDAIKSIKKTFDKDNLKSFIDVLGKHELSKDVSYANAKVLTDVTPENLDQIITLLEKTDANKDDIKLVFKYLDKVNVAKLEQVVLSELEPTLTTSLSEAIDDYEDVIASVLGLSRKAAEILKKTATEEDYKLMNVLPDVIFENYREVKRLNVNNLEECISKYPHRFTLTHSKFHEILDRYDTDDLIRCINKNAAVIDKL